MGILNNLLKAIEPAAGQILTNVAVNMLVENKNGNSNRDPISTDMFIDKSTEIATKAIANGVKKVINNEPRVMDPYEYEKAQKYDLNF